MSSKGPRQTTAVDRKGTAIMTLDPIAAGLAVAALIVLALTLLGVVALRYGVDSRPGIGDRDRRPWLYGG